MTSKKTTSEILSFKRLKTIYKPKIIDSPDNVIYNALFKLEKLLDNAIFPMYSFEPQNDIVYINEVTSIRNKNKEARKVEQEKKLPNQALIKNTCFQCFENINQCFAFMPNLFQKDTDFVRISNEMVDNFKSMLKPPETVSRVYVMPHLLAYAASFKKLERKKQVSYGIMMERLTSGPSIPIIDKPWNAYQISFYQALLLCKLTNTDIDRQIVVDYMMSWESNTPSVLDYRFFILSNNSFFHERMERYYDSFMSRRGPVAFFQDFIFINRPYYCREKSIGFLSARWLLPFNLSSVFSASEIGIFSTINQKNIVEEDTIVHKLNYDLQNHALYVVKRSTMYDVVINARDDAPVIEQFDLPKMNIEVDESAVDDISFTPAIDFDQKTIVFNIKDYEGMIDKNNGLGVSQQVIRDQQTIREHIRHTKALSEVFKSEYTKQDIFKGRYYSRNLLPQDFNMVRDYNRRLMINEIFHQWSRDLLVIDIMKDYIMRIEQNTSAKEPISFVHEVFIKPAMLNEFDRIMLNNDYVFFETIQPSYSQLLRTFANAPLTTDDIMIRYFLFLNSIYDICLTTMRIDVSYLQINTDMDVIVKHIRKFTSSLIVNWVSIWLIMQNIPYDEGYDMINSQHVFNKKMLPLMYVNECIPIQRKYYNRTNCFSSKLAKNDEYMWSNTRDYISGNYHALSDFLNRQIDLAKLSFFKSSYAIYTEKVNQIGVIDPKRYFLYKNRLLNEKMVSNLISITMRNVDNHIESKKNLRDLCHLFSPVKEKDGISKVQNMIDFYMACIDQMNCYMQYMMLKGNEFIKQFTPQSQKNTRAGAVYINSYVNTDGDPIDEPRRVQFENILNKPRRTRESVPTWLFEFNPNLQKLEIELSYIKTMLSNYQRPDINQLAFFIDVVLIEYPSNDNDRIIDILPLISEITDALHDMIRNHHIVDIVYATQKTDIMNTALEEFVDIYVIDTARAENNLFRRYIKAREHFDPMTLNTIKSRQEKLERWIFIEKYVSHHYKVVDEFYKIMDTVQLNTVGIDSENVITRFMHSLYESNNFINRDLPIAMNKHHEMIERNIALAAIDRNRLRDYIEEKKTIVELSNFSYLFKSRSSGVRYSHNITSLPVIHARWEITIRNVSLQQSINHYDQLLIRVDPDISAIDTQGMYKVHLPYLPDNMLKYVSDHETCFMYANLVLSLIKPPVDVDSIEEEQDLVTYPPLSLPGSSVTILGHNAIEADPDQVYQRINRFNNFMYINQPEELFFLHINLVQELI
jgi:hypothetical protein